MPLESTKDQCPIEIVNFMGTNEQDLEKSANTYMCEFGWKFYKKTYFKVLNVTLHCVTLWKSKPKGDSK